MEQFEYIMDANSSCSKFSAFLSSLYLEVCLGLQDKSTLGLSSNSGAFLLSFSGIVKFINLIISLLRLCPCRTSSLGPNVCTSRGINICTGSVYLLLGASDQSRFQVVFVFPHFSNLCFRLVGHFVLYCIYSLVSNILRLLSFLLQLNLNTF